MPLDSAPLSERLPTAEEADKTRKAIAALGRPRKPGSLCLRSKAGAPVDLPPAVSQLVLELLTRIGKGETVALVSIGGALSTQEAADLLNVSRPFVVKLLENRELPFFKVGTHRRIRADDLLAYRRRRDERRQAALTRMMQLGQEIDAE